MYKLLKYSLNPFVVKESGFPFEFTILGSSCISFGCMILPGFAMFFAKLTAPLRSFACKQGMARP